MFVPCSVGKRKGIKNARRSETLTFPQHNNIHHPLHDNSFNHEQQHSFNLSNNEVLSHSHRRFGSSCRSTASPRLCSRSSTRPVLIPGPASYNLHYPERPGFSNSSTSSGSASSAKRTSSSPEPASYPAGSKAK
jgi:hypothetical protein